jgi:peptidoglycan/xylan/chitin deacetylase (PgdA/CDA1 family)
MTQLTIVMYHYVRPIKGSAWPKIKGLELEGFRRQIDYLSSHYQIVTAEDVIDAVRIGKELPSNACWLTFDDGYKDHYIHVLPELCKKGIQGSFFPPVKPITERVMLDVNSIHHILASVNDIHSLVADLNSECRCFGISDGDIKCFWDEYAVASRYDTKEVIYVKRLLQHALPETIRNKITSNLFEKYVGLSQIEFANHLYMSVEEVRDLVEAGMYVGSHGYRHLWLNREDRSSQKSEIDLSLEFLSSIGARTKDWIMCYPYGGFNQDTLDYLEQVECAVGVTTEVGKVDLKERNPLTMPRFDTNDFPQ